MDELHIRIDKNYNIKAMNTNTEIAGNAFFRAGKKLIEAEEIEFRAGKARLTLKNQLITIEGNNISLKSMGDVKLKGKNIYKEEAEKTNSDQDEKKWIKLALNEDGNCEGLQCAAHFDDGSVRKGTFDSNNTVSFNSVKGATCSKIEIQQKKDNRSLTSVTQSILNKIGRG